MRISAARGWKASGGQEQIQVGVRGVDGAPDPELRADSRQRAGGSGDAHNGADRARRIVVGVQGQVVGPERHVAERVRR